MHTKNVRMRPVPLWGRCTGSTDFTSRKKNTRKTNGATKQHSMRDQRQLWKSFSSSFASFEFTYQTETYRSHSYYKERSHREVTIGSIPETTYRNDLDSIITSVSIWHSCEDRQE